MLNTSGTDYVRAGQAEVEGKLAGSDSLSDAAVSFNPEDADAVPGPSPIPSCAPAPIADDALPSHLVSLVPSEWAVWNWFVFRGAGFPGHLLSRLSDEKCGAAADWLIASENRLDAAYEGAARELSQGLDAMRFNMQAEGESAKALVRALWAVRSRKLRNVNSVLTEFKPLHQAITSAAEERAIAQSQFETAFQQSIENQSRELRSLARHPRLQEAVVWQNRQAFETGIKPIANQMETSTPRNTKQRQHEELVANYLQRYCAKNDTIGFYGPVAWGRIEPGDCPINIVPGTSLVRLRQTYFENWAIDALAAEFSSWPGMEWWISPRLVPHWRVEGMMLHPPLGNPIALDPLAQAVLSMCNGQTRAIDIVAGVQSNALFGDVDRDKIRDLLRLFIRQRILVWRLTAPLEVNPENNLWRQLLEVEAPELRAKAIRELERLDARRREVAAASGDVPRLNSALNALEATFQEITRTQGQKSFGQTYAGRTLVYEDCQRDVDIKLAPSFFEPILPALTLLLRSLRWLVHSTGLAFRDVLQDSYNQYTRIAGKPEAPAAALWMIVKPIMDSPPTSVTRIERLFKEKWGNILQAPQDVMSVSRQSSLLKESVEREFPLPESSSSFSSGPPFHPGYFCPDIMVAAPDLNAIQLGHALYILGEFHLCLNTLTSALFVAQHPAAQELLDAVGWDYPNGSFQLLGSPRWEKVTTRTNEGVFHHRDFLLSSTDDSLAPSGFIAHPISELVVREQAERLVVVTRNGCSQFEILEAFSPFLYSYLLNKACWLKQARHTPRITIDSLVVQRETWVVPMQELAFAEEKGQSQRFLGARRWMKTLELPRIVFVKSPIEVKPFYLDFDSPVYVEIFSKMARRLKTAKGPDAEMSFSEMLPGISECWLPNEAGELCTSEIRFALVDLSSRRYFRAERTVSDDKCRGNH